MTRLTALSAVLLATACTAPNYEVAVEPAGAILFVDGREAEPAPRHEAKVPYYGTLALTAMPSPLDSEQGMRTTHAELEIAEPVTPWVFPLDFLIELGAAAFGGTTQLYSTALRPEPRTDPVVAGTRPTDLDELRRRAEGFAIRR